MRLDDAVRWMETGEPIPLRRSVGEAAVLCRGVINRVWVSEEHGYRDYLEPRACLIPPLNNSVVRLGVVKLPFGVGLIVTAYQTGNGITIVVHGTIINETGWRELLARTSLFFSGAGPVGPGWSNITGVSETGWVLWRIMLEPRDGAYLAVNGTRIPIRSVIILLEMPVYRVNVTYFTGRYRTITFYWYELEQMYWDVVAHPALALAIHLANPPDTDIESLYRSTVLSLTRRVVLTGVEHPGWIPESRYYTPFLIRKSGKGVCNEQSRSTSLFASNALGAYTAYIVVDYYAEGWGDVDHAISLVMYAGRNTVDTDRDGKPDAIVLVDTAGLPISYINQEIENIRYESPLIYVDPYDWVEITKYGYFLTGVVDSILGLPGWLKAPWLNYAMERSNFTGIGAEVLNTAAKYCRYLVKIGDARRSVSRVFSNPVYVVPPSVALALNKVIDKMPVVYEAVAPPLREVNCTGVYQPGQPGGGSGGETGGGNGSSELPPADINLVINATWDGHEYRGNATVDNTTIVVIIYKTGTGEWVAEAWVNGEYAYGEPIGWSLKDEIVLYFTYKDTSYKITVRIAEKTTPTTINAAIQLTPVYVNESTPWGQLPVFKEYVGTAMVNQTNVTVVASYSGVDEFSINVYVNGSRAYTERAGLPATIAFKHGSIEYRLRLEPPEPPVINETVEPELEPVDTMPLPLPNGTVINITVYKVNETIKVGNVTIVVFGYVSRLSVDIDIYVFGVPPGNYTVNVTGLEMNQTIVEYVGALHVYLHYQAPENQLIPENTLIRIMTQSVNLTIIFKVK